MPDNNAPVTVAAATGADRLFPLERKTPMKLVARRSRGKALALPLFAWADERDRRLPLPYAARWVRHRWPGFPLARAALVARLSGLGGCNE